MASNSIPGFYRAVFAYIDPFFICMAMYHAIFNGETGVNGSLSTYIVKQSYENKLLLDYLAGCFAMLGCMQIGITRLRPNDVVVWKVLQFATLILDVVQIASTARTMLEQGHTDPATFVWGEWQNTVGNTVIGGIRLAFILGIGLPDDKRKAI